MKTEELLLDIQQFVPAWKGAWEPAPGMLDFEEKWDAFHDPKGRLMICAHRGDYNIYYPENSLEGYLAAILAGADMLEVDVHTTLDGELVLMHDETLTRTTNVGMLRQAGEDWMPESDEIAQWTLAQIRRLRLITKEKALTQYAVPTLREVISIAKDRVFVTLDKADCFRWEDAYALICEQRAYRTVLIPYNYPLEQVKQIRREMLRRHGICCPFFAAVGVDGGIWSVEKIHEAVAFLKENHMSPILRGGYHNLEDVPVLKPVISQVVQTHRIYAESMGAKRDFPETWQSMLDMGYSIFMGNRLYELLRLVKERHFNEV